MTWIDLACFAVGNGGSATSVVVAWEDSPRAESECTVVRYCLCQILLEVFDL